MEFIDWIISIIPEQYKPFVGFAIASLMVVHFYGDAIRTIVSSIAYRLTNKEAA